jgi:hypothetical protein
MNNNWCNWYAAFGPPTWSNWILAAFAVVAAVIGLRTLAKIRQQTRAAVIALKVGRVAARAAQRSADTAERALSDLERPWVFVDVISFEGFRRGIPFAQIEASGIIQGTLKWNLRNYGRSPAFLLEGRTRIRRLNEPFPEPPDYGNNGAIVPHPMAPNKLIRINTPWIMNADDYRSVIRHEARFVFYGFIRYRNTFQSELVHISRWCAVLNLPTFRLAVQSDWGWVFEGPAGYTEYT